MKTLVVEDDFVSRLLLQEILKSHGPVHLAVTGDEAIEAAHLALEAGEPYDLICLDIMMPGTDGQTALKEIRALEEERGIPSTKGSKIVMTTALDDTRVMMDSFYQLCDAYVFKPVNKEKLLHELVKLGLVPAT